MPKIIRSIITLYFILVTSLALTGFSVNAATLLPPGKQQFFDVNGNSLSSGSITFYVPNTTTLKNTWQNANQTILNTNPVVLDAGGFAVIYGSGQYRMIVRDSSGNLIYDQLTSSTAEVSVDNIVYYATSVGGAANAITVSAVSPTDYTLTLGKTLRFISPLSNTGSTVLNPLALGVVTIKRVTNIGTVNLAGGEIVAGGVYDVLYDGTNYILLNPSVTDNPCDLKPFAGSTAPNGYALTFGQAISRTTFSSVFACAGVAWGPGNGSTTFNLPDLRGRSVFGKDDMGGSAANRITAGVSGITGTTIGAAGGNQNVQQHNHVVNVTDPGHTHTVTDPGHTHTIAHTHGFNALLTLSGITGAPGAFGTYPDGAAPSTTGGTSTPNSGSSTTGITAANSNTTGITATTNNFGTGTAGNVPPAAIVNWLIRL